MTLVWEISGILDSRDIPQDRSTHLRRCISQRTKKSLSWRQRLSFRVARVQLRRCVSGTACGVKTLVRNRGG